MTVKEYPSARLLLVRHGQARSNDGTMGRDTPLSELGKRQAEAVAEEIASNSLTAAVYTSPFPRAVQTSAPLCRKLGTEAAVDPRLAEFQIGGFTLEVAETRPDLLVWRPEHRGVDGGETLEEFAIRVASFCDDVVERHLGETVVVVAHSGTIGSALHWALGLGPSHRWQADLPCNNGSITEIEFWPRGRVAQGAPRYAELRRIGDESHLGGNVSEL